MTRVGLRVDVDTYKGTRVGVPELLRMLARHRLKATFFFTVGPDNMGRHLWRMTRPRFAWKMLRSNAVALYGPSILLAGTAWPGRLIGRNLPDVIRETDRCGHEVGLHAWDHHAWQKHAGDWGHSDTCRHIQRGLDALTEILARPITCSAAAGWRADQRTIDAKETFGFRYNSDCRGRGAFRPLTSLGTPGTPQIPVSLPTFDEVVGLRVKRESYNDFILDLLPHHEGGVYTVHAEAEGGSLANDFDALLTRARDRGIAFVPLSELLPDNLETLPCGQVARGFVTGREGWLGVRSCATGSFQGEAA